MRVLRILAAVAIAAAGLFIQPRSAFAYPELTRYGYVNCTACHIAPTGGGTLTQYGREASRAVLSTWGAEGEERPLYFINQPEWLNLGGDYRSVWFYQNTPVTSFNSYQFMQADAEAAASWKKWTLDASIGYQDPNNAQDFTDHLISRTHYLMYHATDQFSIRGGRFFPAYGIFTPNHDLVIRDQLNIHEPEPLGDGETYDLEFSYLGEKNSLIVTGIFGRPDNPSVQRDIGASIVASHAISDNSKVGLSYLYGTNDLDFRNVVGPYGIIGFTNHIYLLAEADFQSFTPKTAPGYNPVQWGFAETTRWGFEPIQGLNFVVDQEFSRTNFSALSSLRQRYGIGVWWFPRPHLEAAIEYQKRQDRSQPFTSFYDYLYIVWHYYI